jgi:hypothetical protein
MHGFARGVATLSHSRALLTILTGEWKGGRMGAQAVGYLRNIIYYRSDLTGKTNASITMRRDLIISGFERLLSNIKATGVSNLLLERLPGRSRSDEPRLSEALDIYAKLILYRSAAGEAEHANYRI